MKDTYSSITRDFKGKHFIWSFNKYGRLCKNQRKEARFASNRLEELFNVALRISNDTKELDELWTIRWDYYWAHIHDFIAIILATIVAISISGWGWLFHPEPNWLSAIIEIIIIVFLGSSIIVWRNTATNVVRSMQDWLLSKISESRTDAKNRVPVAILQ